MAFNVRALTYEGFPILGVARVKYKNTTYPNGIARINEVLTYYNKIYVEIHKINLVEMENLHTFVSSMVQHPLHHIL